MIEVGLFFYESRTSEFIDFSPCSLCFEGSFFGWHRGKEHRGKKL